jgi:hypothetical protein
MFDNFRGILMLFAAGRFAETFDRRALFCNERRPMRQQIVTLMQQTLSNIVNTTRYMPNDSAMRGYEKFCTTRSQFMRVPRVTDCRQKYDRSM